MPTCKKCGSNKFCKSGIIKGKQRFRCKKCNCNFRMGDNRTDEKILAKKALCILLYTFTDNSFRKTGKLVQTDHTLVYRWICKFKENTQYPQTLDDPASMFEEILRFTDLKKEGRGYLAELIETHEKLLPEYLVTAIQRHLEKSAGH